MKNKLRYYIEAIGLGIVYMIIALIVQELFESIPVFYYIFVHGLNLSSLKTFIFSLEIHYVILYSIYIGLLAGIMQETATYIAVDTRKKDYALFIGLGFSIIDIVILFISTINIFKNPHEIEVILIILNIISSLLFHPGTATFMKWGWLTENNRLTLLISIFMHAMVDGGLVYADIFILTTPHVYIKTIEVYWAIVMVISIFMFLLGYLKLRNVKEPEKIENI